MNPQQEKAALGFVVGAVALAALQTFTGREAAALGLPHVVAGLFVAAIGHELA